MRSEAYSIAVEPNADAPKPGTGNKNGIAELKTLPNERPTEPRELILSEAASTST